jgi:hypothetical protein
MYIQEAICSELSAVTGLTNKVFPIEAQQGLTTPYCIYKVIDGERMRTLSAHDGLIRSVYQLDLFHTSYTSLLSLRRLVMTELRTWEQTNLASTGPYIQECSVIDEPVETFDDDTQLYQSTIEFTISYTES